jgi:hypothetical protein
VHGYKAKSASEDEPALMTAFGADPQTAFQRFLYCRCVLNIHDSRRSSDVVDVQSKQGC